MNGVETGHAMPGLMPASLRFSGLTFSRAVLLGAVAVVLAVAATEVTRAADDEEETFDEKIIGNIMRGIGLRRGDEETIEYRERSPLVVPPSRALPPPESDQTAQQDPAWPKDQDLMRRREAAKKRRSDKPASQIIEDESRPLSRTEIDRGRRAGSSTPPKPGGEKNSDLLSLSELGFKGFTFGDVFGNFGKRDTETAPFTGEPARATLTQPPAGYQTPSPSYPYGVNLKAAKQKPTTLEERTSREQ